MYTNPHFQMTVKDVFVIRGRGTVAVGQVEYGVLNVGDEVQFMRQGFAQTAVVTGIESFRKQLKQAQEGDNVGVLLRDIGKQDIQRGDVLTRADFR